jgi:hypothetical protein
MRSMSRELTSPAMTDWRKIFRENLTLAKKFWGSTLTPEQSSSLKSLSRQFALTILGGELRLIDGRWYVTHAGLMHLSLRNRSAGSTSAPWSCSVMLLRHDGHLKLRFTNPRAAGGLSVTVTLILPMFLPWSKVPRCAWLKPVLLTAPCGRPTVSASARSRNWDPLPNRGNPHRSRRGFRYNLATETTAVRRSVTACARSSASEKAS